ncbi:hypothetical protein OG883_43080 [Streptomyces sp. NBC_01142]|uniref:hypothetical protein n=1 Tax=Streptomyces sp. NBC_01142 TaxID=2975865 RepID=UPI00224E2E75|nr:hypothetical protein [Streptomyces sp. NBC_01142]MCX4826426.1 hypothetical protein [Streptomyces sp. NBC_01142]
MAGAPPSAYPQMPLNESTRGDIAEAELVRRAQRENQRGMRMARALDNAAAPPEAGPRDLAGIDAAMNTAQNNEAWYWSHPDWHAIRDIRQQVNDVLARLNEQAEITPQAAINAAKITTLAASLIARHAAKVSAHLDAGGRRDTPGGQAMRTLTRVAEDHAARASGLDSVQALDTPRLLIAHVFKLNKELRRAEPDDPELDLGVDGPDDPALESALSTGAAADPELAEASQLMTALSELAGRARRGGHRLALDVRLHGMVETAQLRGFEMISGIAQAVMRRYDNQGRGTDGRRNIAAMIFHYAEQRLERMRGTLGAEEQRDFGHYETDPPERYMDALFEESRTVGQELRAKNITPQERTDLQIRFLLAQKEIAAAGADGVQEWGTQATFPPNEFVAGMRADNPVETRLALVDALRRRVENNPFHRDAQFLNKVADRFAQEIAGPPELTAQALEAELSAEQVRAVAAHVVEQGTVASPLVLSETDELNLTHAQAERALAVLQTLSVVGPPNGLKPRETLTVSRKELPAQLELLEQRLPNLLEIQKGAAAVAASSAPPAPVAEPEAAPTAEASAPAEPEPTQAPAAPAPPAPAVPAPAADAPELPRRDRSADRRHPGNLGTRPTPAAEAPTDQDLAQLFEGQEDRVKEVSQKLIAGTEARAAHPAPAENAPAKTTNVDEAQHNAQQNQQTVGGGVR